MSYQKHLSLVISPTDQTNIMSGLDGALNLLNAIKVITLTPQQRKEIPAVTEGRLPYVQTTIQTLAPSYPDLVGKALNTADAQNALNSALFLKEVKLKLNELQDRVTDLGINLENTAYLFMLDMYYTAERYNDDLPGADVVLEAISPLFAGQGEQNPQAPTP